MIRPFTHHHENFFLSTCSIDSRRILEMSSQAMRFYVKMLIKLLSQFGSDERITVKRTEIHKPAPVLREAISWP